MKTKTQNLLIALALLASLPRAVAQAIDDANTAIAYQGQLSTPTGSGSNGRYDLVFRLFNASSGGSPVAGPITNTAIAVNTNGLFSTTMNFGSGPFTGKTTNWLEIAVRTNGVGAFITLSPRQVLTATPQSIYALNAGTAGIATTATNFTGSVSGDVSGTQGATVVATVGGQTAANVASGVLAANTATSANTPNTIVKRDGSGSFAAGSATLGGNLYLPFPARIYSGSNTVFIEEGSTFVGMGAGFGNTGLGNVGVGDYVLSSSPSGSFNTSVGENSLQHNTTGSRNKADGYQALYSNTSGSDNTAIGYQALHDNTTGFQTRPTVLKRYSPIPPDTTTRPTAIRHFTPTRAATPTRPMAPARCSPTRPAAATQPAVIRRSTPTRAATITRRTAWWRFSRTRPALETPPRAPRLFSPTRPGPTTLPAALLRFTTHDRLLQHGQRYFCALLEHDRR